MKILLIGLLTLGSISVFAQVNERELEIKEIKARINDRELALKKSLARINTLKNLDPRIVGQNLTESEIEEIMGKPINKVNDHELEIKEIEARTNDRELALKKSLARINTLK
ncbi:MAG: hypothetical protein ACOYL6_10790, partial [Bacteriovoracaceae bacterium]